MAIFFHSMLSLILLFQKSVHRQLSYSKEGYRDLTLVLLKSKSIQHYLVVSTRGVARGGGQGGPELPRKLEDQQTLFTPGGRLCPSHYCQPPWIQKAIYTSGYSACWEPRRVCDNSVANSSFI